MKAASELFILIKSLTPSERGHFKKISKNSISEDSENELKYIALYEEIQKIENEDEFTSKSFEKKLIKKNITKNYADDKTNLQELILKSLRLFHSNKGVDMKLSEALKDIYILKERKLPKLHLKAIIKAKEIAVKYERYIRLIEVLNEEIFYCVAYFPPSKIESKYNELQSELKSYLELHHQLSSLKSIKTFLYKQVMTNQTIQDIDQIEQEIGLYGESIEANPLKSFHLSLYYYSCKFLLCHYKKETRLSMEFSEKVIGMYQAFPYFKTEHSAIFQTNACNHITLMVKADEYERAKNAIEQLLNDKSIKINEKTIRRVNNSKLLVFLNTGMYYELDDLENDFIANEKIINHDLHQRHLIKMYYNLSIAFLFKRNFKKANDYNLKILNLLNLEKPLDFFDAKLAQLIIQFEMDNYNTLIDMIRNIKREKEYQNYLKIIHESFFTLLSQAAKEPKKMVELKKSYHGKLCNSDFIQVWLSQLD